MAQKRPSSASLGQLLSTMAAWPLADSAASLRSTRTTEFFLRRTFELSFELQEASVRARAQARTDDLTGLANRRAFLAIGTAALDQARRYQRPLSILVLDVDHFKRVNDTHGHAAGDAALRAVADALRAASRAADTPGRLGGEEFAMLLPETPAGEGERVAEPGGNIDNIDALLNAADGALYQTKAAGRDRVVRHIVTGADRRMSG